MFKEFLAGTLTKEDWGNLVNSLDKTEPDFAYASDVRVSLVAKTGTFYLSDKHGFLCSVTTIDHLLTLLALARDDSLRGFLKIPYVGELIITGTPVDPPRQPTQTEQALPLSPAQIRARQLADDMQARRGLAPIAGDTSDVEVLRDTSENDAGFSAVQAEEYLNLGDKLE